VNALNLSRSEYFADGNARNESVYGSARAEELNGRALQVSPVCTIANTFLWKYATAKAWDGYLCRALTEWKQVIKRIQTKLTGRDFPFVDTTTVCGTSNHLEQRCFSPDLS
jgi:hypothetical protein